MRVTVCLAARSDGTKLLPYVLVNRKRPVPKIEQEFKGKLIVNWYGSVWMDDVTTDDYLRKVIKAGGVFSGKRLLVWDAFAAHKSVKTMAVLKELGIEAAYIPGGCTKFIQVRFFLFNFQKLLLLQAPDVSWNKPYKGIIRDYYSTWMTNDAEKEFTKGGNPKAPALEVVLRWIYRAWQGISKETIINSFKGLVLTVPLLTFLPLLACALTTAIDGTEDDKITCFKPEGSIGTKGLNILREMRALENARDGRNDFEEAGIEETEEIDFEHVNEEEMLMIED